MRISFPEIAKRLTGFSTPFFGVSWTPPQLDRDVAARLLGELEDRRVLFGSEQLEVPEQCVHSVQEIRRLLNDLLPEVDRESQVGQSIRAMRAACRSFLDRTNRLSSESQHLLFHQLPMWEQWELGTALGEVRAAFGVHLAQLSVAYGIDVEEQLVGIFPAAPE